MTEELARRIAVSVLTHANAWYVADTGHRQERVVEEATKTVLREFNTPHEKNEPPSFHPWSVSTEPR